MVQLKSRHPFLLQLLLLAGFLFYVPMASQAAFDDMVWGARPAGLGGAYTALSDDADGPASNPAGAARSTRQALSLSYASLFSGLKLYAGQDTSSLNLGGISFVDQRRSWGTLGAYWNAFQAQGVYREDTAGLSWGSSYDFWGEIVCVGGAIKALRHSFAVDALAAQDPVFHSGSAKSAVGVDLGLQWEPAPNMYPGVRLAVEGRNLNSPDVGLSQSDRVPAEGRLGLVFEKSPLLAFTPVLEFIRRNGKNEVAGGLEKWFLKDTLAARFGGNSEEAAGGFSYLFRTTGGISYRMDYSFSWPLYVDRTAGTHRLSLAVLFGGGAEPKKNSRFSQIQTRKSDVLDFLNARR